MGCWEEGEDFFPDLEVNLKSLFRLISNSNDMYDKASHEQLMMCQPIPDKGKPSAPFYANVEVPNAFVQALERTCVVRRGRKVTDPTICFESLPKQVVGWPDCRQDYFIGRQPGGNSRSS